MKRKIKLSEEEILIVQEYLAVAKIENEACIKPWELGQYPKNPNTELLVIDKMQKKLEKALKSKHT